MKKNNKIKIPKQRDYNILASIHREIDLRTKSESLERKKYTRKEKHKKPSF